MSTLYRHLRIHQVFGVNTDVGKTLLTAALARASLASGAHVSYLKPVSTGPMSDADDEHIKRFAPAADAACLFRFDEPVSPHLAAPSDAAPTDAALSRAIAAHIRLRARVSPAHARAHMYVETAGGVHSPAPSGASQLDAYQALRLPTLLVADARLGGISATRAAYESMLLRGYTVDQVLLFRDEYYRNDEYLRPYFAERGVRLDALPKPPPRLADAAANFGPTEEYYAALADGALGEVVRHLDERHEERLKDLESMPRRTLDSVWWPFVQHKHFSKESDVNVIDSAAGDYFSVYTGHRAPPAPTTSTPAPAPSLLEPQFDGSASWWTQALGHAHPELALAAAHAAGRYGHVMFPGATHAPALELTERLLKEPAGAGWAARVFLSDDGSTGMEVALKMALRAYLAWNPSVKEQVEREDKEGGPGSKALGVLGLEGSYHGDTIGAMDACAPGVYACEWHAARGFWLAPPTLAIRRGRAVIQLPESIDNGRAVDVGALALAYDVAGRLENDPLAQIYEAHITQAIDGIKARGERIAALVLEPLVLGAGGMRFVDPLFQALLVRAARAHLNVPVVFDEVFAGLRRLGAPRAGALLGAAPDVSVHAKILTGGVLPLAATLASARVFDAFLGDEKAQALLHGHSYSAHAVGCAVANAALDEIAGMEKRGAWDAAREAWAVQEGTPEVWSVWAPSLVDALSKLEGVREAMAMGTVLAITLEDAAAGYTSHAAAELLAPLTRPSAEGEAMSAAPGGAPFGVHHRTLGNVAYFMTSLNTPAEGVRELEEKIWGVLSEGLKRWS